MSERPARCRLVVLISGRGSNMLALADACARDLPADIVAVISNEPGAAGLASAAERGLKTEVVAHRKYPERATFDDALADTIDRYRPDLVVMAGFMRIVTPPFIKRYLGRMLNIHPSLLPDYPGLNTHARALADQRTRHGATVHFVTDTLDGGPRIAAASVTVVGTDDADTLAARVLEREHELLPSVVGWFATGRLTMRDELAWLDGQPLNTPFDLDADPAA
ncbi:MAG: phosphoribosylglycinamide formyltransferase [Pseudomonadota bacterium]